MLSKPPPKEFTEEMQKQKEDVGRNPGNEIEVTPEMIAAGASVLYKMELAFAGEEFWAEEVYRAMASLTPAARVRAFSTFASARGVPSS